MPWLTPDPEIHNCLTPDFTRGWHFKNWWLRRKPLPLGSRWQCPCCRQIWVVIGGTYGLHWATWEAKPPPNTPRGKGGIVTGRTTS